ncbi:hypothetical protein [Bradyrhizobium sp.]|uniref:hypothetical protein n=1 Tax=Bradyrhizobium sp. TaxID=376 RepID=UPI0039E6CB1E
MSADAAERSDAAGKCGFLKGLCVHREKRAVLRTLRRRAARIFFEVGDYFIDIDVTRRR